jgi:ERCC4-type nuclease
VVLIAVVYVDERERNSKVPEYLTAKGVTFLFKMLDVGDYIIGNTIGVERKTANDYINSIIDGRLFTQLSRLKEKYDKAILIIEGNTYKILKERKIHRNAILGSYVTITFDLGVTILYSKDEEETAELIKRLSMYKPHNIVTTLTPRKPKTDDILEWQKFILQCFPHIGSKIAQRILEYFGSIHTFCNASIYELSRIEGLTEQKAAEIYQVIHAMYKESQKVKLVRTENTQKSILDYLSVDKSQNLNSTKPNNHQN